MPFDALWQLAIGANGLRSRFCLIFVACVGLSLCLPADVEAQVPRILGQGAAATGMGNAFAAQADDASALHYNPAGMTQLHGVEVMFGALLAGGTTDFTQAGTGATSVGDRYGPVAWPPPGHFYLTANLKDLGVNALGDLTVGIGLTVPFGSLTRYPENGPLRNIVTYATLPLFDIKPTIAYKFSESLSLGLGADIYTFSQQFGQGQLERQSISPLTGAKTEFNGKGTTAGFNVSLLYTALRNADGKPLANVAVVYRSRAALPLSGELLSNGVRVANATSTLVAPPILSGGVAIWPVRDRAHEWKLELDVEHVGWNSDRDLDIHCSTVCSPTGSVINQPLNWRSGYTILIGTEYRWLQPAWLPQWELALRAGYSQQQNQMPDATFDPGIPASNSYIPSVGVGLLCHEGGSLLGLMRCGDFGVGSMKPKGIGVDIAYAAAIYEDRVVTGNTGLRAAVNGEYRTTFHTGALSFRFIF
jgi:long-chain fatty acid transport protein